MRQSCTPASASTPATDAAQPAIASGAAAASRSAVTATTVTNAGADASAGQRVEPAAQLHVLPDTRQREAAAAQEWCLV